jgi:type IV fimbrial biogenesis protein FimT
LGVLVANKRGFTLIELLVTIAIAAILAVVAVPSFNEAIANYRLTSYTNNFLASAQLARSEAIKRNSRMTLCKSANGTSCTLVGGWHQGWIIFNDVDNSATINPGEIVVYRESAMSADFLMLGSANVDSYVSFVPSGATELISGGLQQGTLTLCSQSGSSGQARRLIINSAGRLRVTKPPIAPCV